LTPKPFDIDELRALIEEAQRQAGGAADDAYTMREWAERLGLTVFATNRAFHALKAAGRLESCQVRREMLNGVVRLIDGYRVRLNDEPVHTSTVRSATARETRETAIVAKPRRSRKGR
jgi:hypothetical protein